MSKKSIRYLVKCPYCDKTYTIDTKHGEDFCCPTCNGAGTLKDAVRIEETATEAKPKQKNVFENKWMQLERPSWFGEDKKIPTEEDYQYSTEEAGTERAFEIFVAVICILLALFYMKVNNG